MHTLLVIIAPSSQLARLLAAIIANRLLTHCSTDPRYQLQYWNVAFQPNKAIDEMLVNLVTDGNAALANDSAINVVAADISSAYDSIHIESLMYKLRRNFDLTGRILNWLYNFLKLRWTRVVIGNSTGEWKQLTQGLKQGCTLSPILTAMFCNDYHGLFPQYINVGAFVDDFTFWQNPLCYNQPKWKQLNRDNIDNSHLQNYYSERDSDTYLQLEITHFINWCNKWQLSISVNKCQQLFICTNNINAPATIRIGKRILTPVVAEAPNRHNPPGYPTAVRILGLQLTPSLTWQYPRQLALKKARRRLGQLKQLVKYYKWEWKPTAIWRIYLSTIQPLLEQNAVIVYSNFDLAATKTEWKQVWSDALRLASGLHRTCSVLKLQKLFNARSPNHIITLKFLHFWLKCKLAPPHTFAAKCWTQYLHTYASEPFMFHSPLTKAYILRQTINTTLTSTPHEGSIPLPPPAKMVAHTNISGYGIQPLCDAYDQQRRPPPSYIIPLPTALNNAVSDPAHTLHIYTDGSTRLNPGRATAAWYYRIPPALRIQLSTLSTRNTYCAPAPHSINNTELIAIERAVEHLYLHHTHLKLTYGTGLSPVMSVTLHSDSLFCVSMFTPSFYPRTEWYYNTLQSIFHYLTSLANDGIYFNIEHVSAHQYNTKNAHHIDNNIADKLARTTCQQYKTPLHLHHAPYDFYFQNIKQYVHAFFRLKFRSDCAANAPTQSDHKRLLTIPDTDEFVREMRCLTLTQARRINRIRCGYTNPQWNHINAPYCPCDNQSIPTTRHLIYSCNFFNQQRHLFRNELQTIEPRFNDPLVFNNLNYILFPHLLYTTQELKNMDIHLKRIRIINTVDIYCKHRWPNF